MFNPTARSDEIPNYAGCLEPRSRKGKLLPGC